MSLEDLPPSQTTVVMGDDTLSTSSKAKFATTSWSWMDELRPYIAEFLGSFLFIWCGITSVAASAIAGALAGLWQVSIGFGIGLTLAIYSTAHISGGHMNPAITLALAVWNRFPWSKVPGYIVAQMCGGILAGAVNLALYGPLISYYEIQNNIVRGSIESIRTAMVFGEYYPNPAVYSSPVVVSSGWAFAVEAFGTGFLAFIVLNLTDPKNKAIMFKFAPFMIGALLALLIGILGEITQGGFNPARDFGPRIVAYAAGWGSMAIPGPNNNCVIYIFAPIVGAQFGAASHVLLLRG